MGITHHCTSILILLLGVSIVAAAMTSPAEAADRSVASGPEASHPHRRVACRTCHPDMAGSEDAHAPLAGRRSRATLPGQDAPVGAPAGVCRDCHRSGSPAGGGSGLAFHLDAGRSCLSCHFFHQTERLSAAGASFSLHLRDPERKAHCAACHAAGSSLSLISGGHRVAAQFYHSDTSGLPERSPSEACLACHSPREAASGPHPIDPGNLADIILISRHASHPVGIRVVPGRGNARNHIRWSLDPRIRLFSGRMECQSCHDLANPEDDHLVRFETKYELCRGCHQHNAGPDPASVLITSR